MSKQAEIDRHWNVLRTELKAFQARKAEIVADLRAARAMAPGAVRNQQLAALIADRKALFRARRQVRSDMDKLVEQEDAILANRRGVADAEGELRRSAERAEGFISDLSSVAKTINGVAKVSDQIIRLIGIFT